MTHVFEGLENIRDTAIITDPNVKPVQHSPGRVPVAVRHKVKAKLTDLERKGIVEKVLAPTEWISTMVRGEHPKRSELVLHFDASQQGSHPSKV